MFVHSTMARYFIFKTSFFNNMGHVIYTGGKFPVSLYFFYYLLIVHERDPGIHNVVDDALPFHRSLMLC